MEKFGVYSGWIFLPTGIGAKHWACHGVLSQCQDTEEVHLEVTRGHPPSCNTSTSTDATLSNPRKMLFSYDNKDVTDSCEVPLPV